MPPQTLRLQEPELSGVGAVPLHVAIIMDGNRRWARARGKPPVFGHRQGAESVRRTIERCRDVGVRYLTLFAFSSENWARPPSEVRDLMNLLRFYLRKELDALHKNGVRVRIIGNRDQLDADIQQLIERGERKTAGNQHLDLIVALNYGSRHEIADTAKRLAKRVEAGELSADRIDERMFGQSLSTVGIPDPDLLIRTSGEQRISNFLLWQLAYTEFVFLDTAWPDFDHAQLDAAIEQFGLRERRFGARAG